MCKRFGTTTSRFEHQSYSSIIDVKNIESEYFFVVVIIQYQKVTFVTKVVLKLNKLF